MKISKAVLSHLVSSVSAIMILTLTTPVYAQDSEEQQRPRKNARKQATEASQEAKPQEEFGDEILVTNTGPGGQRRGRLDPSSADSNKLDGSGEEDVEGYLDNLMGISTLGGDEEGNLFSFQGMSPELSQMTINGQNVGMGGVATELVERVEVIKSPMASMEEGASSGTVNVRLRSPVTLASPVAGARARVTDVEGTGSLGPSLSGNYGRSFMDKKYGFMVNFSYRDNYSNSKKLDTRGWLQSLTSQDGAALWAPKSVRSSISKVGNARYSGSLILGAKPLRNLDITLKAMLAQTDKEFVYSSLQGQLLRQNSFDILAADGDIVTSLMSRGGKNLKLQLYDRHDRTISQVYSGDIKWSKARTVITASVGYNESDSKYPEPSPSISLSSGEDFGYNLQGDNNLPIFSLADGAFQLEDFSGRTLQLSNKSRKSSSHYASLDFDKRVTNTFFRRLKAGVKHKKTTFSNHDARGKYRLDDKFSLDQFSGEFNTEGFTEVGGEVSYERSSPYEDIQNFVDAGSFPTSEIKPKLLSTYDIEQETNAAYFQGDVRYDIGGTRPMIGNFGVRYVETKITSNGHQAIGEEPLAVTEKSQYSDVLPSASILMRVKQGMVLELGLARVLTRPRLNMLGSSLRLNEFDATGSAGNSALEPFRANQVLAELRYSRVRAGRYTVSVAYKDVDNFFVRYHGIETFDDVEYLVARPSNGENASILSLNFSAVQSLRPLSNKLRFLLLEASFTYNKSRTDFANLLSSKRLPMPGITPKVIKASISFNKDKLSAKLRYQWLGKTLVTPSSISGLPDWQESFDSVDFNVGYKINAGLSASFDIRNIMSNGKLRTAGSPLQLIQSSHTGRRITLGLRAKF